MAIQDIRDLQPQALWRNFYKVCQVPHPSHHLSAIQAMLMDFGKSLGLETFMDEPGNVIIRKPATPGMESCDTVTLQAHMDMVPQKNNDVNHDFEKDPIQTIIDGDWVHANQTTLGADDGIGVATAMAILESKDLKHGPIEVLITADEETGMYGAFGLKPGTLKGKILLNMDSEDEGELYIGCAGGVDANMTWEYQGVATEKGDVALRVTVKGLKGGHSGLEINQGRANANKLVFRFLKDAIANYEARLAEMVGGNMRNAIPREGYAIICVPAEGKQDILNLVEEYRALYNNEFKHVENEIQFFAEEVAMPEMMIPEEIQDDFVNAIISCPSGVFSMIATMPDKVETSMNLSIVEANATNIDVKCLIRGSVDSRKEELASMVESIFSMAGAKVEFSGSYSGWAPNVDSPILKTMHEAYNAQFGVEPKITVVHAGLECGIIGAIEKGLDMISIGPTIRHPHSPDEKVNIPSVQKFWDFVVATLANMPTK